RHTRSYGDWSSDVCSSDLFARRLFDDDGPAEGGNARRDAEIAALAAVDIFERHGRVALRRANGCDQRVGAHVRRLRDERLLVREIGRAWWRVRGVWWGGVG